MEIEAAMIFIRTQVYDFITTICTASQCLFGYVFIGRNSDSLSSENLVETIDLDTKYKNCYECKDQRRKRKKIHATQTTRIQY